MKPIHKIDKGFLGIKLLKSAFVELFLLCYRLVFLFSNACFQKVFSNVVSNQELASFRIFIHLHQFFDGAGQYLMF